MDFEEALEEGGETVGLLEQPGIDRDVTISKIAKLNQYQNATHEILLGLEPDILRLASFDRFFTRRHLPFEVIDHIRTEVWKTLKIFMDAAKFDDADEESDN